MNSSNLPCEKETRVNQESAVVGSFSSSYYLVERGIVERFCRVGYEGLFIEASCFEMFVVNCCTLKK